MTKPSLVSVAFFSFSPCCPTVRSQPAYLGFMLQCSRRLKAGYEQKGGNASVLGRKVEKRRSALVSSISRPSVASKGWKRSGLSRMKDGRYAGERKMWTREKGEEEEERREVEEDKGREREEGAVEREEERRREEGRKEEEEKRKRRAKVEAIASQMEFHDLRRPHEWYPHARSMTRKIIMHVGPTNSGKTHAALQRLKEAKKGVYCGPLRLLAEQVFERLNLEGVPCDLVTGEKVIRLEHLDKNQVGDGGKISEEDIALLYRDRSIDEDKNEKEGVEEGEYEYGGNRREGRDEEVKDEEERKGEEKREVAHRHHEYSPHSHSHSRVGHVSCTVEMTDVREQMDVALIDEYQLIGDESRGWAWTRALLGVPSLEVHLCGDTSAIDLVKSLLAPTNDEIEIRYYDRLSPLTVASKPLSSRLSSSSSSSSRSFGSYGRRLSESLEKQGFSASNNGPRFDWVYHLKDGDAVIVFSRKAVFQYKKEIEERLGIQVSVVYGSLPPETRSQQAKKFNSTSKEEEEEEGKKKSHDNDSKKEGEREKKILVATDAIGLGLNLNIGRVIFSTTSKYDGVEKRSLKASEVRQIGGRAGRFSSLFPSGIVTSLDPHGIPFIKHAFSQPVLQQKKAGLFPTFEHIQRFESALSSFLSLSNFHSSSIDDHEFIDYNDVNKKKKRIRGDSRSRGRKNDSSFEKDKLSLLSHIKLGGIVPPQLLSSSPKPLPDNIKAIEEAGDSFEMDPHLFGISSPRLSSSSSISSGKSRYEQSQQKKKQQESPTIKLGEILDVYEEVANLSGLYFLCSNDDHKLLAHAIDHLPLTLREKYTFVLAPVNAKEEVMMHFFSLFASSFSRGYDIPSPSISLMASRAFSMQSDSSHSSPLLHSGDRKTQKRRGFDFPHSPLSSSSSSSSNIIKNGIDKEEESSKTSEIPSLPSGEPISLRLWELMYKILDLYLWLSYRFEGFVGVEEALDSKAIIETQIALLLDFMPPDVALPTSHSRRSRIRRDARRERSERFDPRFEVLGTERNSKKFSPSHSRSDRDESIRSEKRKGGSIMRALEAKSRRRSDPRKKKEEEEYFEGSWHNTNKLLQMALDRVQSSSKSFKSKKKEGTKGKRRESAQGR